LPEKINEQLVNLGITDAPAPNTIAKYIPNIRKNTTDRQRQSWRIFLKNHSKGIWAMDFFVVPTLCFQLLYVFLIVSQKAVRINQTPPHPPRPQKQAGDIILVQSRNLFVNMICRFLVFLFSKVARKYYRNQSKSR